MKKRIIFTALLWVTNSPLYANNSVFDERIDAVAINSKSTIASHVAFTINNTGEINITDIDYSYYVRDKDTSSIKVVKATNCYYPKKWAKRHFKGNTDTTIREHGVDNVRPIVFWCDNDIKFTAYSLIKGSALDKKPSNMSRGKNDPKPLTDGNIVMFMSVGYVAHIFVDVTDLPDPHSAILERFKQQAAAEKKIVGVQRGPGPRYSLLNKPAPMFSPTMLNDNHLKLKMAHVEGKVWVMVSWAAWCEPCTRLFGSLSEVKKNSNAVWVGVNYDKDQDGAMESLKLTGNLFDYNLHDASNTIATKYKVLGLPNILIMDKEGIIRYRKFGNSNMGKSKEEIESFIKKLNQQIQPGENRVTIEGEP